MHLLNLALRPYVLTFKIQACVSHPHRSALVFSPQNGGELKNAVNTCLELSPKGGEQQIAEAMELELKQVSRCRIIKFVCYIVGILENIRANICERCLFNGDLG